MDQIPGREHLKIFFYSKKDWPVLKTEIMTALDIHFYDAVKDNGFFTLMVE